MTPFVAMGHGGQDGIALFHAQQDERADASRSNQRLLVPHNQKVGGPDDIIRDRAFLVQPGWVFPVEHRPEWTGTWLQRRNAIALI
jgi:hypothetical protein